MAHTSLGDHPKISETTTSRSHFKMQKTFSDDSFPLSSAFLSLRPRMQYGWLIGIWLNPKRNTNFRSFASTRMQIRVEEFDLIAFFYLGRFFCWPHRASTSIHHFIDCVSAHESRLTSITVMMRRLRTSEERKRALSHFPTTFRLLDAIAKPQQCSDKWTAFEETRIELVMCAREWESNALRRPRLCTLCGCLNKILTTNKAPTRA